MPDTGRRKYRNLSYIRIGRFEGYLENKETKPYLRLVCDGQEHEAWVSRINHKQATLIDKGGLHARFYQDKRCMMLMGLQQMEGDDHSVHWVRFSKVCDSTKVTDIRLKTLDVFVSNYLKDRVDILSGALIGTFQAVEQAAKQVDEAYEKE